MFVNVSEEEWVSGNLAEALDLLTVYDEDLAVYDEEAAWRRVARFLDLPIREVYQPGAACACYVPELFCPTPEPRGLILLNMYYGPRRRGHAIRHEIGHHLLWTPEPNMVFGRRFPLDPHTEAYLLRERLVQRAERLCFRRSDAVFRK